MKNSNVAVYFRCSTDKQDKSIADQRELITQYAKEKALSVVSWFDRDEGKSGTSFEKRPDFMRMVRLIESRQHEFSRVLVYDVDRWGRPIDPEESGYWEFHLRRFGVTVEYISDPSLNERTMAGRLTKSIKQELATEESRKQSLRVRERSILRAKEGFRVGGFAPYGFKRVLCDHLGNKIRTLEHGERKYEKSQRVRLEPGDPKEIRTVRQIFSWRAQGLGACAICNRLNRQGVPPPASVRNYNRPVVTEWNIGVVLKMLTNPTYVGDWVYNRQASGEWVRFESPSLSVRDDTDLVVVKNCHEAIIDPKQFRQANTKTQHKRRLTNCGRSYWSEYLLSGLIRCDSCGGNFTGHRHKSGSKHYHYYEDLSYRTRGEVVCQRTMIPKESIESFVVDQLNEKIHALTDVKRLRSLVRTRLESSLNRTDETIDLRARLHEIELRISRLRQSIEDGVDYSVAIPRIKELTAEREETEGKLAKVERHASAEDPDAIADRLVSEARKASNLLSMSDPRRQKEAIRLLVKEIVVNRETRTARCYIRQIPRPTTPSTDLYITECRRSESNRHGIATGGF